ncbi:MAG TPA: O-antigen ligase family protein [Chloroflexia bacterium]|nr:O-antigen ligase family protein [Chloroflexia bacterium]
MKSSDRTAALRDIAPRIERAGAKGLLSAFPLSVALVLLLVGASLEQPAFDIGSVTIKPEHLVLSLLWALIGWRLVVGGAFPKARLLLWIIPYVAVLVVASVWNSPDPAVSLRQTVMVGLVASAAWLAYGTADTRDRLMLAVDVLIWLAALEAALIFLSLALAWIGVPFGAQPGRGGIPVPNGTLREPNLLGSYLAAGGILALARLLSSRERRHALATAGALALILTALGLSLARGAWLGFAAGVVLVVAGYVVLRVSGSRWAREIKRNVLLGVLAGVLAALFLTVIAPAVFPGTSEGLGNRLNLGAYDPQSDPSVLARVDTVQQAWPNIWVHPVIGHGTGSFGMSHTDEQGSPGWIPNLILHVLYDGGLVGLACWLAGVLGLAWVVGRYVRAVTAKRVSEAPMTKVLPPEAVLGLVGAVGAILVAFQVTEGSWLSFPWVYLGLLVAAIGLTDPDTRSTSAN